MTALPQRKSPRLQGYDYAQSGVYFVTICTIRRVDCFGVIENGVMTRSPEGEIAHNELVCIPDRWHNVDLDLFVVMPNHVHAIVVIESEDAQIPDGKNAVPTNDNDVGTPLLASAPSVKSATPTLGNVVGAYKAGVTRLAREQGLLDDGELLWQTRFHDHIVRSERALDRIREYVVDNPARWPEDAFYSA